MTITWFEFLIAVLATFRLSTMFATESGPMRIFKKLRNAPSKSTTAGKSAKEGLSCPLCLGVHFAAMITTFLWWQGRVEPIWSPLLWMGIAGGAVAMVALHPKIEQ